MSAPGTAAPTLGPFADKATARARVWEAMAAHGVHRFPFPIKGRIPNFRGAEAAARRLIKHPWFQRARVIKVNPDAPQRPLREAALAAGKVLLVPTPRLRDGFREFVGQALPPGEHRRAASLSHMEKYGRLIALDALPRIDLMVVGSVCVDLNGRRAGKGEGYADLEYAALRELGRIDETIPVVTTVHDLQVTRGLPASEHDLTLDLIVTPTAVHPVPHRPFRPTGILWERLSPERVAEMPFLAELARRRTEDGA